MSTLEAIKKPLKLGTQTGSFFNHMMSSNSSLPEVGKGATVLLWSDRHAYQVMEVSEDKKRVVVQQCNAKRTDKGGMTESQEYDYSELTGVDQVIVFKWGAWKWELNKIVFEQEYEQPSDRKRLLTPEQLKEIYKDDVWPQVVVPGITKAKKVYGAVSILWGEQREYYDYSF